MGVAPSLADAPPDASYEKRCFSFPINPGTAVALDLVKHQCQSLKIRMSFKNYLPLMANDQTVALADQEYREHQARFSKQKRRDRLWELPKAVYCSVIGTCVTLEELRKISKKDKSHNYESLCDYQLHKTFVSAATN